MIQKYTLSGITYDSIHIVGGGANAAYLNELTAEATGKTVYAGPTEATAIWILSYVIPDNCSISAIVSA